MKYWYVTCMVKKNTGAIMQGHVYFQYPCQNSIKNGQNQSVSNINSCNKRRTYLFFLLPFSLFIIIIFSTVAF